MIPLLALAVLVAPVAPSADILSPREFQVFQRDAGNVGQVRIEGTCSDDVETLGVTFPRKAGEPPTWQPLALDDLPGPTKHFHGVVEIEGGGWYAASVSRAAGEGPLAEVEHVGVGEVFVVAGQSNSTNFGEERTVSQDDQVAAFDGARWWIAADPLPGVQDSSQGGSPWPICGALLRKSLGVPVAFASCGFG
jgi:hypothetical protein